MESPPKRRRDVDVLPPPFKTLLKTSHEQVGINLGDPVFRGIYHGKRAHEDDFEDVLQRAKDIGVEKLMVTGSDLHESMHAIQIARDHRSFPSFPFFSWS
jgi:hypothetical protein